MCGSFALLEKEEETGEDMATTKKTTPKKEKPGTATYKGQKFTVLEKNEQMAKLTDGLIHFWAKLSDVEIQ